MDQLTHRLQALSPLDGRYRASTAKLATICSEQALMRYRLRVEIEWLKTLADEQAFEPLSLNPQAQAALDDIYQHFDTTKAIDVLEHEAISRHDIAAIISYLRDAMTQHPLLADHVQMVHFAMTSEDVNNLSYALMIKDCITHVTIDKLDAICDALALLIEQHHQTPMMARTHGQPASPTTFGKEMALFADRLLTQRERLMAIDIVGKCNGATGNYNAHVFACPSVDWRALSKRMVHALGLKWQGLSSQIEPRDHLAEILQTMIRIDNILLDLCQDCWTYIAMGQLSLSTIHQEVGSSTMPHKVNPIFFENAEGNLGMSNAILSHMASKLCISRLQRDLSDSTVLRNLGVAHGHAALAMDQLLKGLSRIQPNVAVMRHQLDEHPELTTEAVQSLLKCHGIQDAYDILKSQSRGKVYDSNALYDLLALTSLPAEALASIKALKPHQYIGLASPIALSVLARLNQRPPILNHGS